jgi:putative transposase
MAKLNTNKGGKKLNYIHNNPIAEHWQLVNDPCKYVYSTCKYYETGENNYTFIKDLRNEF